MSPEGLGGDDSPSESEEVTQIERAAWRRRVLEEDGQHVWSPFAGTQAAKRLFDAIDTNSRFVLTLGEGANPTFQNYLTDHGNDLIVHSVDWLPSALAKARANSESSSTRYISADAAFLPFSENSFDVVFPLNVVLSKDHAQNERILSECRRVLKPCGQLIGLFPCIFCPLELSALNPDNPITDAARIDVEQSLFAESAGSFTRRFYTPLRLHALLDDIGFDDVKIEIVIFDSPDAIAEAERVYNIPSDSDLYVWELLVTAGTPRS